MNAYPACARGLLVRSLLCGLTVAVSALQGQNPGAGTSLSLSSPTASEAALAHLSEINAGLADLKEQLSPFGSISIQAKSQSIEEVNRDLERVSQSGSIAQKGEAHNLAGVIFLRVQELERALREFELLDIETPSPTRPLYRYNRARAFELLKRSQEALLLYKRIVVEDPDFPPAALGLLRLLAEPFTGIDAKIQVCLSILDAKRTEIADRCFQQELPGWAANADPVDALVYLVRRFSDPSVGFQRVDSTLAVAASHLNDLNDLAFSPGLFGKAIDGNDRDSVAAGLKTLSTSYSRLKPPLDELVAASAEESKPRPVFDVAFTRRRFPLWTQKKYSADFAKFMFANGERFRTEARDAKDRNATKLASNALTRWADAWNLDNSNADAVRHSADILVEYPDLPERKTIIANLASSVDTHFKSLSELDRASETESWLLASTGDAVAQLTSCTAGRDSNDPLYFWLRALYAERQANDKKSFESFEAMKASLEPRALARNPVVSASIALDRRIADCYRDGGNRLLSNAFAAAIQQQREKGLAQTLLDDKIYHHARSMIYAGGLVKSFVQASLLQGLDTPAAWGQGARGLGERFASSQATRMIRQALALGLDSALGQDPFYVRAPYRGIPRRFLYAVRQTVLCRSDRLRTEIAVWRIGSAFGAQLVSNVWRPVGTGIGDQSLRSAAIRASFDLAGDTASNVFREFLPRRGRLGRYVRWFL